MGQRSNHDRNPKGDCCLEEPTAREEREHLFEDANLREGEARLIEMAQQSNKQDR